ncbi:ModD protein [Nitrospirillum amazonense]|uniref:Putative pyrophosphorylase ModD n=1 Tax=Nitrospirillum amazonense TaxID=28077 RepID=A0A560JGA0_9PROT|nr:ModD protein [Nitrospirillum amazonense]MDG3439215.1 ModD protein [Nitrospirillum amazonense]TWB69977.1 molybdenum transport protein [Nitrospirillum amazonense]
MAIDAGAGDPLHLADGAIERLLEEDVRFGDLTTRALGIGGRPGRMRFQARADMVLSGVDEAARLLARLGAAVTVMAPAGCRYGGDAVLLEATGSAAALHAGWKVAQTLMEWASGLASETRAIVDAARAVNPDIAVLCTRKSVPYTRQLACKAVLAGGGDIHRLGLSDTILLFPEHRVFFDPPHDLAAAIARLKRTAPERAVMVEVTSEEDALAAAAAHVDVIQLEKFAPEAVHRLVRRLPRRVDGRPVVAAAGGVTAQNAGAYAKAGADTLVTSAPFFAKPRDIQVTITAL